MQLFEALVQVRELAGEGHRGERHGGIPARPEHLRAVKPAVGSVSASGWTRGDGAAGPNGLPGQGALTDQLKQALARAKQAARDDDQLADVQLPNGVDGRLRGK